LIADSPQAIQQGFLSTQGNSPQVHGLPELKSQHFQFDIHLAKQPFLACDW